MDESRTLLVDAPSLFYRALFATPDSIQTPEGVPINAAYGFIRMVARLIEDNDPDHIAMAADQDWRPQWRVKLIPSYKAVRAEPGSDQEKAEERLAPQVPVIYELLRLAGINTVGHDGAEAEDIIGTLAARAPGRVSVFSGDRDLFQLVEDPKVSVLYPIRGVSVVDVIDESYIEKRYGIPGRAYSDFAVLRGDPSDGLPGVRGIGEKLAAALVAKYGSLDAIIEAAEAGASGTAMNKVKAQLDYVKRAQKVVAIPRDLPLPDTDLARPTEVLDAEDVIEAADAVGLKGPVTALVAALESRSG